MVVVERYRLLSALKECNFYDIGVDGRETLKGGDESILDESDNFELLKQLQILSKTVYVSCRIKTGELSDPESIMLR